MGLLVDEDNDVLDDDSDDLDLRCKGPNENDAKR